MQKVALHNLGCKVNSYELDVIGQKLQEKGYTIVPFEEQADVYVINTCTVTNIADRKSRQMLHQAKKRNPEAIVVAVGCYVQTGKEQVLEDAGIDLAIGNNRKKDLVEILESYLADRQGACSMDKTMNDTSVIDINATYDYEEMQLTHTAEHTRAYIKVQDGCSGACTFCIVPQFRGKSVSVPYTDVMDKARRFVDAGYREIVLTGIETSDYGKDIGTDLITLLETLDKLPNAPRLRLGSLDPAMFRDDVIDRLSRLNHLCHHLHLHHKK